MLRASYKLSVVGAIVVGCAVGGAAPVHASPCDPMGIAMTPQPVLSCTPADAAPSADGAPAPAPGSMPPAGGQLGYLRQVWREFHNGVPSDLIYGPAPTDPPADPAPPPPGDPALLVPPTP